MMSMSYAAGNIARSNTRRDLPDYIFKNASVNSEELKK